MFHRFTSTCAYTVAEWIYVIFSGACMNGTLCVCVCVCACVCACVCVHLHFFVCAHT